MTLRWRTTVLGSDWLRCSMFYSQSARCTSVTFANCYVLVFDIPSTPVGHWTGYVEEIALLA